jgi:hypothetical protein
VGRNGQCRTSLPSVEGVGEVQNRVKEFVVIKRERMK